MSVRLRDVCFDAADPRIIRDPNDDSPWWVLVDPEDNEFCAFAAQS